MANQVWANTNISGYVMHNSIGIVICSTQALYTGLHVFAPRSTNRAAQRLSLGQNFLAAEFVPAVAIQIRVPRSS